MWSILYDFGGFEGLTSTRLTSVRPGRRNSEMTMSEISSGAIFQSAPLVDPPVENSVDTLPGMMLVTRTLSWRWSSINASLNPFNPNFDALYADPPGSGFLAARLLI